jgi:hypothetical protein
MAKARDLKELGGAGDGGDDGTDEGVGIVGWAGFDSDHEGYAVDLFDDEHEVLRWVFRVDRLQLGMPKQSARLCLDQ